MCQNSERLFRGVFLVWVKKGKKRDICRIVSQYYYRFIRITRASSVTHAIFTRTRLFCIVLLRSDYFIGARAVATHVPYFITYIYTRPANIIYNVHMYVYRRNIFAAWNLFDFIL